MHDATADQSEHYYELGHNDEGLNVPLKPSSLFLRHVPQLVGWGGLTQVRLHFHRVTSLGATPILFVI
jgi:hypothetical protein